MRLLQLRKEKGISQVELAKKIGCSQNAISCYENGSKSPGLTRTKQLADFFGVSVDYLLGDDSGGNIAVINQEDISKAIEDNERLKIATRAFDLIMSMPPEMQRTAIAQLQALADLNKG